MTSEARTPSPSYKDFPYQKILILGATSGIGWALAEKFLSSGKKIIITGRRESRLQQFIETHSSPNSNDGEKRIWSHVLDTEKLDQIEPFIASITASHPDLDCILLNSGIQRAFDFSIPESVNVDEITSEVTINYLSHVHFTTRILPHLISLSQKQGKPTALLYVSSGLAFMPVARCLNYCATKAAIHHFVLSLRYHMNYGAGTGVKVVEIVPPAVQTELHDEVHQPDIKNGREIGIPIEQFLRETWEGLVAGEDEVVVGSARAWYELLEPQRKKAMESLHQIPAGRQR